MRFEFWIGASGLVPRIYNGDEGIGVFKALLQGRGGGARMCLLPLICFDEYLNPIPTNGKSVPTMLVLNLPIP